MRWTILKIENQRPERFFLWVGGFFGLLFLFLTPPLQVPDEPAHFLRAWQISEGNFFADREDNRIGGWVPLSLEKFSHPYWLAIFPGTPVTVDTLIHSSKISTNPEVKKFKDFNNTALYSPLCYAPQALGIFIFRVSGANPFYCFYAGRLLAFLTWMFCICHAIRMAPIQKWLFVFLALLPMSIYVNMSLSADLMTNAICFLFLAAVLKFAFDDQGMNRNRLVQLVILVFLVVSVKSIYAALVPLVFLIPGNKFVTQKSFVANNCLIILTGLGGAVLWSRLLTPALITYEEYNPVFRDDLSIVAGADAGLQMKYILGHGTYFFEVFGSSVVSAFEMYAPGYIGTFGWLTVQLPIVIIILSYLVLFLITLSGSGIKAVIGYRERFIFAAVFLLCFFMIFLSQHLIWDPVGGTVISNIQGRYLIPVMPLFFLAFSGKKLATAKYLVTISAVCAVFLLAFSVMTIYHKYLGAQ